MGNAWDINDDAASQDEEQDTSEAGGSPASKTERGMRSAANTEQEESDDCGLNSADTDSGS